MHSLTNKIAACTQRIITKIPIMDSAVAPSLISFPILFSSLFFLSCQNRIGCRIPQQAVRLTLFQVSIFYHCRKHLLFPLQRQIRMARRTAGWISTPCASSARGS